MISIDLREAAVGRAYQLTSGLIVPRPIAFVSTISAHGEPNLAPFSFFNAGGSNPPSLMICTVLGPNGEPKDTLVNVCETGELVVNLVNRAMAEGMNQTSVPHPHGVNEWPLGGFTPLDSVAVRPRRVAESPIHFECRLEKVIDHGEGPSASRYILAEVLIAHVQADLMTEDLPHSPELIARLGGSDYLDLATGEKFQLKRPRQS